MARKTRKIDAVNRILSNIGQSPVTVLDSGNPLVEMAELVLDEISSAVQSEGWIFNTEYSYPFTPNADKNIVIPEDVLSLDSSPTSPSFVIIRKGKLYDKNLHSYIFEGVQYLDVLWLFDFIECPEAFREYITIRAANVFAGRSVGSAEAVSFGQREEVIARATALEYDSQQGDYNIFQNENGYTTMSTYSPWKAVARRA